jgi:Na+-transporting NADH:ubiquinone oxidoreductase subunit C
LGAEIATREFQQQFAGKTIFNEQYEFTSIEVVKGGVANSNINPEHGVDAISGGTITSNGVTQMLKDVLSIYEPFVKKQIL